MIKTGLKKETGTILFVDDEEGLHRPITMLLEEQGYRVWVAKNGAEAISRVKRAKEPIHLLLVDMSLPDISGSELVEKIKALKFEGGVMYFSGRSPGEPSVQNLLAEPKTWFAPKPIDFMELCDKISGAFQEL